MSTSRAVPGPLSVEADLSISIDGYDYRVSGAGDRLMIEAPSLAAALTLLQSVPDTDDEQVLELLETADLTADVHVRGTHVASLGAGVDPDTLTRPLGGPPAGVRSTGVAAVVGKELRARPLALAGVAVLLFVLWRVLSDSEDEEPATGD